jgi:16S rRNA (guanine966-N2)-methyltransferase
MVRILSGMFKGKRLPHPSPATRPTSERGRETVFNLLAHNKKLRTVWRGLEGAVVLDGFAGTGALGLEALSRGASKVFFVEQEAQALCALRQTVRSLSLLPPHSTFILEGCFFQTLPLAVTPADLIFLDPPYHQQLIPSALQCLQERSWIGPHTLLVLETQGEETLFPSSTLPLLELLLETSCANTRFTFRALAAG